MPPEGVADTAVLSINGTADNGADKTNIQLHRVLSAKVQVFHGNTSERHEAQLIPNIQFVIHLPLDHDATIALWAMSPLGPNRFKKVQLVLQDRSGNVARTWMMPRAYVYHYEEVEFPPGSGSQTDQGNYAELIVRGTLHNAEDYSGQNLATVQPGTAEGSPAALLGNVSGGGDASGNGANGQANSSANTSGSANATANSSANATGG